MAWTSGMATKPSGSAFGQAANEIAAAHAGVDQDGHGPGLEQGEDQRDEVDARPDQQGQPRTRRNAHRPQPCGDPVAVLVQLAEREVPVAAFSLPVVPQRLDHGNRLRHGLGHSR